jgi:hypothetical protein
MGHGRDAKLRQLLSLVKHDPRVNYAEGLDAFRARLETKSAPETLRFLAKAVQETKGEIRGGLLFVLAEHFLRIGDLDAIERQFDASDDEGRASILNGLPGQWRYWKGREDKRALIPPVLRAWLAAHVEATGSDDKKLRFANAWT